MTFKKERTTFTGGLGHIMSFIKDYNAIFDYLLVVREEKGVKEVVVRHDEKISELLRLDGIEIGAKILLSAILFHFFDIE